MSIDNSIVSVITQYLHEKFDPFMYAYDFKQNHYNDMLQMLNERYNVELLAHSKGSIKTALKEFFAISMQEIEVKHKGDIVRIEKNFVDEFRDEEYDRLIHRVNVNILSIKPSIDTHKKNEFLYELPKNFRDSVLNIFDEIFEGELRRREAVRRQMQAAFPLNERDIILFLRGHIYIREFIQQKCSAEIETSYSNEELEEVYKKFFPDGAWNEIELMLPDVLFDRLNFAKISNEQFLKRFIPTYTAMIDVIVAKTVNDEEYKPMHDALGNYILRIYFDEIMQFTAKQLMDFLVDGDINSAKFVMYYDNEVVIQGGKKKKRNVIVDESGHRWTYSSILSVLKQWKNARKRIDSINGEMLEKKEKADKAQSVYDAALSLLNRIEKEKSAISDRMKDIHAEKQMLRYKLDKAKTPKDKEPIQKNIAHYNTKLNEWQDEFNSKEEAFKQQSVVADNCEIDLKNRLKLLENDKETINSLKEQNKRAFDTYDKIAKALAEAMAKV